MLYAFKHRSTQPHLKSAKNGEEKPRESFTETVERLYPGRAGDYNSYQ